LGFAPWVAPCRGLRRFALLRAGSRPAARPKLRRSDLDPTPGWLGSRASACCDQPPLARAQLSGVLAPPRRSTGVGRILIRRLQGSALALVCAELRCSKPEQDQDQELSVRPSAGPSHFSLRGQREVTKRKATPRPRSRCIPAPGVRVRWLGFSTGHPWPDENHAGIPAGVPSGDSASARRFRGAPLKSAGSCPQEPASAQGHRSHGALLSSSPLVERDGPLSSSRWELEAQASPGEAKVGMGRGGHPRKRIH